MFLQVRSCARGISIKKAYWFRSYSKLNTEIFPVPQNVDVSESTRFSPRRNREISATVIVSQNHRNDNPPRNYSAIFYYEGNDTSTIADPHVQSYDCFGTVNLNSAMQSNVPSPFSGMHKFSHLNMPRGQWSQEAKFMSQNLHNSHYLALRKNTRSNWSSYNDVNDLKVGPFDMLGETSKRYYRSDSDAKHIHLTKKDKLKKAFRDYGSTIIVFHIALSLTSLGAFYVLVSSGIDVIAQLEKIGFGSEALKSKVAVGASNFVIAYAIHKLFAPLRISLTLGTAPILVRYLRSKGFLKPSVVK